MQTRRTILEILIYIVYWQDGEAHNLVVAALQTLSDDNHEHGGCYAFWFKSLEQSLIGRGKMGTFVGASEEVRQHGGSDPTLNDYTVGRCPFDLHLAQYVFVGLKFTPHQWYDRLYRRLGPSNPSSFINGSRWPTAAHPTMSILRLPEYRHTDTASSGNA